MACVPNPAAPANDCGIGPKPWLTMAQVTNGPVPGAPSIEVATSYIAMIQYVPGAIVSEPPARAGLAAYSFLVGPEGALTALVCAMATNWLGRLVAPWV